MLDYLYKTLYNINDFMWQKLTSISRIYNIAKPRIVSDTKYYKWCNYIWTT